MTIPDSNQEPVVLTDGPVAVPTRMHALAETAASLSLDGRTAFVTGAGRGIGRSIALALAGAGAQVALCARTASQLEQVAEEITTGGATARTYPIDVTDLDAIDASVHDTERTLGAIDILVNSAGISPTYASAERTSLEDYDAIMNTNVRATFALCRSVGARMLERRTGAITSISSIGSLVALPRLAVYCAAKSAIDSLTRVLAVEWAERGVRVNSVAPGYAPTVLSNPVITHPSLGPALLERIPMGRYADPDEIANAVLFLSSDAASYITGVTLAVDGGWTAR